KLGKSRCNDKCVDFLSDWLNCGNCGVACPSYGHEKAECRKGMCVSRCDEGYGDCDGNPYTGCETYLGNNPLNCGACGVACNVEGGQPCIDGRCLKVECDAGPVTK